MVSQVRPVDELLKHLELAASVCAERSHVEQLRNIAFKAGRMQAFNGVVRFQSPTSFAKEEDFAVSGAKLSAALAALPSYEDVMVTSNDKHLRLKKGPLSVRVRKLEPESAEFFSRVKMSREAVPVLDLLERMRAVRDFMSEDASRLWSVSVLLRGGYLWATNNLSLVRSKVALDLGKDVLFPAPAVKLICELESAERIELDSNGQITINCGKAIFCFPMHAGEWPDVSSFFDELDAAALPEIPQELLTGSKVAEKFSERFTSLRARKIESKGDLAEVEYEVEGASGKGIYNARLLTLILSHATHADFSRYPKPIYFRNDLIEGAAVGMSAPEEQE